MNTRLVNSAAGVVQAAQAKDRTAAGIALALESAGLLMSPEIAAELVRLRARVAELESERHSTNEALDDAVQALRERPDGITRLIAPTQALRDDMTPQVQKLRDLLSGQRSAAEDAHESPLHHSYRVGRDLPEPGGA